METHLGWSKFIEIIILRSLLDNRRIRIGLVDDHKIFIEAVGALLNSKNFDVMLKATNGVELFSILDKYNLPEIMLLDIEMPHMDGIECLKRLRLEYPEILVIMFSRHEHLAFVLHCMQLGAHSYLSKRTKTVEFFHALSEVYTKGIYHSELFNTGSLGATTD